METRQSNAMTTYAGRPGFEGANIHTWIGFKHFMYQLEEAAVHYCRQHALSPQRLFQRFGLCLETVEVRARLLQTLHMDDEIEIEVRPNGRTVAGELALAVEMFVEQEGTPHKALIGNVQLLLRREDDRSELEDLPAATAGLVHPAIGRTAKQAAPRLDLPADASPSDAEKALSVLLREKHGNSFVWPHRIPYFYCHYTKRLHYSGYVRLMEEVVDRFLAERGISIRTMLESRDWIPVVSQARIEILREALLEETIYTVFTLEDICKDIIYSARVDWYVWRNGGVIRTATGRICHGYVGIEGRSRGQLVTFDAETVAALQGVQA